jgi:hypothetical protein
MKPPPRQLPGANSKKWHNRRSADSLGYIRVRTLDNPNWERDTVWLLHILRIERGPRQGAARDELDEAIRRLQRYAELVARRRDTEDDWDAFLEPLDAYLARPPWDRLGVDPVGDVGAE